MFGIYYKIHSIRKYPYIGEGKYHKNNLTYFTCCSTPTHQHWSNDILSRNEKMVSVDSFSLVLLKENVDRRAINHLLHLLRYIFVVELL